jgi:prophage regulatory protein
MKPAPALLRLPTVTEKSGLPSSTLYLRIQQGLWPRPVSLGDRAVGWPSNEVDAVVAARIAGQSNDEIRALVKRLHKARVPFADLATAQFERAQEERDADDGLGDAA